MDEFLTAAATTLVERLAGEAWESAVAAIGGLWRQAHPDRGDTVEAEAVDTRTAALRARTERDDAVAADLVGEWRSRLRRLLAEHPEAVDELRRLLDDGPTARGAGRLSQRAEASGRSRIVLAGRDVHITR
ncbi:hypothetical protein AB0A74_00220 [Saccharothrix sp. NPDC042600]|uniref:hypothetical protein n=1 Tax=Saccharothrix TaxID=2071 RepID=UPI0033F3B575|nr:hypothetical protein GCM10017745_47200 [Saccharothrix mutabilis subsp. capreolus]